MLIETILDTCGTAAVERRASIFPDDSRHRSCSVKQKVAAMATGAFLPLCSADVLENKR